MPTQPCNTAYKCLPCPDDFPFVNWTSEDPDQPVFIAVIPGPGPGPGNPPGPGEFFWDPTCLGICISTISQLDADLCALRAAQECAWPTWDGFPPDPQKKRPTYLNNEQTCSIICAEDGSSHSETVPYGLVRGRTQAEADAKAYALACKLASQRALCFVTQTLPDGEVGKDYQSFIEVLGGEEPYSFAVVSGALPPGIELSPEGELLGQPTTNGTYTFTVRVQDSSPPSLLNQPNQSSKSFSIKVTGQKLVGLKAYWSMDQTSVAFGVVTISDATSNHINLISSFGGWSLVAGKISQALALANGGFADTSGPAITAITNPGNGFTLCGWFKSTFGVGDLGSIWEFDWQGSPGYYFILEINNGGILTLRTNHSPEFSEIDIVYPLDGAWHFYRAGIDPADHKMKLQLDNGAINSDGPLTLAPTAANSFHFGTASFIPDVDRVYDEMGIWNRWLSNADIAYLYNGGAGRTYPDLP
jgi:hypothetical protein